MVKKRYEILNSSRAIYCTAVRPDEKNKVEINPHDKRPGTVHIVSIDDKDNIICGLSAALDTGETDRGELIGLPLENRWKPGDYPLGANLDEFREKFIRVNYGKNRELKPGEMVELYRHFKVNEGKENLPFRIVVYTGAYQLLVREARKKV